MMFSVLALVFIVCAAESVLSAAVNSLLGVEEEASLLQIKNSAPSQLNTTLITSVGAGLEESDLRTTVADDKDNHLKFDGAVFTGWTKEYDTCSGSDVDKDTEVSGNYLTVRTKRNGIEMCAMQFMEGLHSVQVLTVHGHIPEKLNFALFGKLSINLDGFVCTLSLNIGQGHYTHGNNWWLGAQKCNRINEHIEKGDSLWCACDDGDGVTIQIGQSNFEFKVKKATRDPGCGAGSRPLCERLPKIDGSTPFWKANLVATHDSGTGYAGGFIHAGFFKTQYGFLHDQLACGARGLDLRVLKDTCNPDKPFYTYHHGSDGFAWVHTEGNVDTTWPQVVQWCHDNPDELVVGIISHCFEVCGGNWKKAHCDDGFKEAFTKHGGKAVDINSDWTMEEAKAASEIEGGGHLMLVTDLQDDWNCFEGKDSRIAVVDALTPDGACANMLPGQSDERPRTVHTLQAFNQQTFAVPVDPDLNLFMASGLIDFSKLPGGMVEINNVCAYGNDLAEYLGNTVTDVNRGKCKTACADRDAFKEERLS